MTDGHHEKGFSITELLAVLMILGLVTWLATGQVRRSSNEGHGSDNSGTLFADAWVAAARSGTPHVLTGGGSGGASKDFHGSIVVFPDGTLSRQPGMSGAAEQTNASGVPRSAFHALEVRSW